MKRESVGQRRARILSILSLAIVMALPVGSTVAAAATSPVLYQPSPKPRPKPSVRPPTTNLNAIVLPVTSADVRWTYRAGCPVGPSGLRRIQMNFWGYDGVIHRGELIVAKGQVNNYLATFQAAFTAKFRINRMDNPNLWHGDDVAMMAADNTSAFNCRRVTGNPSSLSPHSYGTALDVNTRRNPYRAANNVWYPSNGARWINRSLRDPGMLFASSVITRQVIARGGVWGGNWSYKDYQHFEFR